MPDVRRLRSGRVPSRRISPAGIVDGPSRPRPRRRLRREVRIAGLSVLALVPLVSACTLGWSDRPDRVLACSIAEATASDRVVEPKPRPFR